MDRQTIGKRLDLNMLRFQQPAMMPENYRPPTVGHVPGPSKQKSVMKGATRGRPVGVATPAAKKALAEKSEMLYRSQLSEVCKKYKTFTRIEVAWVLGLKMASCKRIISNWSIRGWIEDTGEKPGHGRILWRKK